MTDLEIKISAMSEKEFEIYLDSLQPDGFEKMGTLLIDELFEEVEYDNI
jgi:hypothetical protein